MDCETNALLALVFQRPWYVIEEGGCAMKKVLLIIGTLALLLTGCGVEKASVDVSGEVSYDNNVVTESIAEILPNTSALKSTNPRFEVISWDAYTESLMTEFDYACYVYGIYVSASEEEYPAIKPIKWIDSDDEARIKELGLTLFSSI